MPASPFGGAAYSFLPEVSTTRLGLETQRSSRQSDQRKRAVAVSVCPASTAPQRWVSPQHHPLKAKPVMVMVMVIM